MNKANAVMLFFSVACLGAYCEDACLAQIKLATDRPQPHSPEESVRMIRVPKGLRVEVAASEPLLADPTDVAFDAQGRVFVCELHGYNLEGYYDIQELNKTGVLDTKVYRIDASREAQERAAKDQYGTVKMLEDIDGDGRFDKATVWADRLPPCYGVAPVLDGVVVACPPDLIYLGDADGDGKPEIRRKLGQTGGGPMWNRPSCPRWNIDNWYYCDGGFRFRARGSVVEPATGTGQFGQTTSDWGDRFFIVQVQPVRYVVPLPHHYLARNPYHGAQVGTQSLLHYNDVYPLAIRVAGLVKLEQSREMKAALDAAAQTALDENAPIQDRQAALALLSAAPFSQLAATAGKLLDARQHLEVQLGAVAALASAEEPAVAPVLLANWSSYTPKVQAAVVDALFSRQNRLPGLLDAAEKGTVSLANLDANRCKQLEQLPDAAIRSRAERLLAKHRTTASRAAVLGRYLSALRLERDAVRGKKVFEQQCAKCHKVNDQGFEVGPDLSVTKTRADETLISDVMDPSSELTVGYRNYNVLTADGRIFNGVLTAETATSITLRKDEGVQQTILRKDIDEMWASPISMMPEDLEKVVTPQDVADLLAFLREAYTPAPSITKQPQITLFEDQASFAEALREGSGTVRLHAEGSYSGLACLAVTPPQRFSPRIPDWEYRITENPGPGEFRYLRFAWKSHGAGAMIELAAEGNWPPAGEPVRRYYSGQNTTGWAAHQVAAEAPRDWVVVTCDLWKDFGSFALTGIAPTAMGGEAFFDRIELARSLGDFVTRFKSQREIGQ